MLSEDKVSILIVDDRPENLSAMTALLSDLDVEMVTALSGNEALRHTLKTDFALVLLDVQMPEMDGFETAEWLRSNPKTRHLPIIFVSAGMKEAYHLFKGYEAGAVDYLMKPIEPTVLRGKVKVFCELARQRQEIVRHERNLEALVRERAFNEAIEQNEERLRLATSASHAMVFDLAVPSGEILNLFGAEQLIGCAPEALPAPLGWWASRVHPEDEPRRRQEAVRSLESSLDEITFEYRVRHENGAWIDTQSYLKYIRDASGQAVRAVGTVTDITARKAAEAARRADDQRLQSHLENSPLAVVEWDADFVVTQWSKEAERLFGWAREETLGRRIDTLNLIYPEDISLVTRTMERLTSGEEATVVSSNRNVTRSGEVIDCIWHNSVLFDLDGRMASVLSLVEDVTLPKRTEAALRASEEQYRSLFSSLLEGFCIIEVLFDADRPVDYRFLEVNPAFEGQTGLPDAKGKRMRELAPGHEAHWFELYGKVARTGEPVRFVNEARELHRWYDVRAYRVGGPESRLVAILFNDITEARAAQESLKVSEERFRLALRNAPVSVAIQNVDLVYQWAYNQQTHQTGESTGRTDAELFGEVDAAQLRDVKRRVLEMGAEAHEERWVTTNGRRRFLDLTYVPMRDPAGAITGIGIAAVDITERKNIEVALHQSEELLELKVAQRTASLDHANRLLRLISACNETLVRSTDEHELVREICRLAVEIGGYRKACVRYAEDEHSKACRSGDDDSILPEHQAWTREPWVQDTLCGRAGRCVLTDELCRGGNECREPELQGWREQAQARGARYSMELPLMVSGEVGAILEVFTLEVDELKEVETDMLHKLANDLAFGMVAIRSREERERVAKQLEHRNALLRNLTAELVQSEQRERQRLAKVLHDHLQQLLVAVKWRTGAMSAASVDEAIKAECRQLTSILDEAIQSSRTLATELSPAVLQEKGIAEALRWLTYQMHERHALTVDIIVDDGDFALSTVVKTFIFDAVRELLFNVIKHAGVLEARVHLSHSDNCLEVTVADEGAGFDLEAALSSRSGTGLGLLGIKERIEYQDGRIEVVSAPGQGSRVSLIIPLDGAKVGQQWSEPGDWRRGEQGPSSTPETLGPKIRLLLVDDHRLVRQGLASMLKGQANIEVIGEAEGGLEAVDLAHRLHPEVVLMDINMPGVDGIEATRLIHLDQPSTHIIGLTMRTGPDTKAKLLQAGAVAILSKSDPLDIILATIKACRLGHNGGGRS